MSVKVVNPHFKNFLNDWSTKFQFLVGGYGSSKSYHVALKLILKLLSEKRTALVVREVYDTHRDSTFSLLEEIVIDLGLENKVRCMVSPMQIRFPNGSKIIFKGMDKPAKLKSINNISIIWLEECSEIKYAGFKELLGRLRHPTLKLHMILSTNPVSTDNWTFKHFFKDDLNKRLVLDDEDLYKQRTIVLGDTYYHHSTADDNKFLPTSYIEQLEEMKEYDPDLYRVARKGRFGVNGKRVLPQFEVMAHEQVERQIAAIRNPLYKNGLDFGFVESYNAFSRLVIDHDNKWLYIIDEHYNRGESDEQLAEALEPYRKLLIKADAAEPKTIAFFKQKRFRMYAAKKGPGSRLQSTKKVKRFKRIICSDKCKNHIKELKNLTFALDKNGKIIEDEFNIDAHCFSSIWYALDDYEVATLKGHNARGKVNT